jgi:hypothetical protein
LLPFWASKKEELKMFEVLKRKKENKKNIMVKKIKEYVYVHIPEHKAYYKVQAGCCCEKVSYNENNLGVIEKTDHTGDKWNSYDIDCMYCSPERKEVTVEKYNWERGKVIAKQAAFTAQLGS